MEKLIIIGSGPAGWTAAIYAGRAQLEPLLITGSAVGGQVALSTEIENYPGFPETITGADLAKWMQQQAERFGTRVVMDEVTNVDLCQPPFRVMTTGQTYEAEALIVATGVSPRQLGVRGEKEFRGRGVSYCATCDGFFYMGKTVVVVGGGDAAVEEALFLTKFATQVTVVHRRDELRAEKVMQERAFANEKIEFAWDTVVEEILGDESGVNAARLRDLKTGEMREFPTDGVFIYVGHIPNSKFLHLEGQHSCPAKGGNTDFLGGQVRLDDRGYIITNRLSHTSVEGVFAAGDVQELALRQIATAVGTGAMAAMEAEKYIATREGRLYPARTVDENS